VKVSSIKQSVLEHKVQLQETILQEKQDQIHLLQSDLLHKH